MTRQAVNKTVGGATIVIAAAFVGFAETQVRWRPIAIVIELLSVALVAIAILVIFDVRIGRSR
jgi:hypothetical protein